MEGLRQFLYLKYFFVMHRSTINKDECFLRRRGTGGIQIWARFGKESINANLCKDKTSVNVALSHECIPKESYIHIYWNIY